MPYAHRIGVVPALRLVALSVLSGCFPKAGRIFVKKKKNGVFKPLETIVRDDFTFTMLSLFYIIMERPSRSRQELPCVT